MAVVVVVYTQLLCSNTLAPATCTLNKGAVRFWSTLYTVIVLLPTLINISVELLPLYWNTQNGIKALFYQEFNINYSASKEVCSPPLINCFKLYIFLRCTLVLFIVYKKIVHTSYLLHCMFYLNKVRLKKQVDMSFLCFRWPGLSWLLVVCSHFTTSTIHALFYPNIIISIQKNITQNDIT